VNTLTFKLKFTPRALYTKKIRSVEFCILLDSNVTWDTVTRKMSIDERYL